jgi:hypothetical protein
VLPSIFKPVRVSIHENFAILELDLFVGLIVPSARPLAVEDKKIGRADGDQGMVPCTRPVVDPLPPIDNEGLKICGLGPCDRSATTTRKMTLPMGTKA